METIPTALTDADGRRLEVPSDVVRNPDALELVSVWFSDGKVKIMTRAGTGLDRRPAIWGEILAGIGENIAVSLQAASGMSPSEILSDVKCSLDEHWHSANGGK